MPDQRMGDPPIQDPPAKKESFSPSVSAVPWHAVIGDEVYQKLDTSSRGLDPEEATRRLYQYGKNVLPGKRPPTIAEIVLHQFKSPLIYILLIAGIISILIGDVKDAGFIFLVVLINAIIGTAQEWKAEQSARKLQSLLKVMARVRRGNTQKTIPAEEIVIGDIVLLESGNRVPADLRLMHAANLSIDESLLTGESTAVQKQVSVLPEDVPVSDRHNMTYAGSTVMTGRGCGIVTGTGSRTEVGMIAEAVAEAKSAKPPLLIRMEDFSQKIGILTVIASMIVAAVALSRGMPPIEVFFLAVALVVSAIPEGLPVGITVALSIAASRMAHRNVIVRRLAAVESLGSCTMIATDKTGTLTVNQQTARVLMIPPGSLFDVSGSGYTSGGTVQTRAGNPLGEEVLPTLQYLARVAVICNEASLYEENGGWVHQGDAMDIAILALAYKIGEKPDAIRNSIRILAEVPFESERMYSAVYYRKEGESESATRIAAKGAMDVLFPYCQSMRTLTGTVPMDASTIEHQLGTLMEEGYRVLAVTEGEVANLPEGPLELAAVHPDLTLLGLVGFIDPLRPDVKEAVQRAQRAGVDVVMITGDHPKTALAIAKDLEIAQVMEQVMTGRQLEELGDPSLPSFARAIEQVQIFARATPVQKMHIVDVLVRRGHFVAVTGDGVNDAPALKRANIGVAMGSGTDVAKDTSSMIITDDNFTSIVAGIEEGRFAYDNIRKVTYLLISTGLSEVILFLLALFFGLPIPLLAVQLLWLNLVTNGIQGVALAFEAGEEGAMRRRPRSPEEGVFNPLMVRETMLSGMTIGSVAFLAWWWLISGGMEEALARNLLLLLMVLFENFHVFNCRSEYRSFLRVPIRNNYFLIAGVILMQGLHILSLHVPFMQDLLALAPISLEQWLTFLILASVIVVMMELFKHVQARKSAY